MSYSKPNRIVEWVLRKIAHSIINKRAILENINREIVDELKPPYLVISNHVNNLDPIFINTYIDEPIVYIVSDRFMKTKVFGRVLKHIGAISKSKGKVDFQTIRSLREAVKEKRVIGLFPEGMRNWVGETNVDAMGLGKLLKSLEIPLLIVNIEGGVLNQPRWADSFRKGKVYVNFKKVITLDEVKHMEVEDLNVTIKEHMAYTEDGNLRLDDHYLVENPAENIERLLFLCPECHCIGSLKSNKDTFTCSECTKTYKINDKGQIDYGIANTREWVHYQLSHLKENYLDKGDYSPFKNRLKVIKYSSTRKEESSSLLDVSLSADTLILDETIPINDIDGINVQSNKFLEFRYNKRIYWLEFQPQQNIFMWYKALK